MAKKSTEQNAPEVTSEETTIDAPSAKLYDCWYVETDQTAEKPETKLVEVKRTVPLNDQEANLFNSQYNPKSFHGEIYLTAGEYKAGETAPKL